MRDWTKTDGYKEAREPHTASDPGRGEGAASYPAQFYIEAILLALLFIVMTFVITNGMAGAVQLSEKARTLNEAVAIAEDVMEGGAPEGALTADAGTQGLSEFLYTAKESGSTYTVLYAPGYVEVLSEGEEIYRIGKAPEGAEKEGTP